MVQKKGTADDGGLCYFAARSVMALFLRDTIDVVALWQSYKRASRLTRAQAHSLRVQPTPESEFAREEDLTCCFGTHLSVGFKLGPT